MLNSQYNSSMAFKVTISNTESDLRQTFIVTEMANEVLNQLLCQKYGLNYKECSILAGPWGTQWDTPKATYVVTYEKFEFLG